MADASKSPDSERSGQAKPDSFNPFAPEPHSGSLPELPPQLSVIEIFAALFLSLIAGVSAFFFTCFGLGLLGGSILDGLGVSYDFGFVILLLIASAVIAAVAFSGVFRSFTRFRKLRSPPEAPVVPNEKQ